MDEYVKARLYDAVRRVMPCFVQHIDAYSYRLARIISDDTSRDDLKHVVESVESFDDLFVGLYRVTAGDLSPDNSARFVWKLDVPGQTLAAGKLKFFQKVSPIVQWKPVIFQFVKNMIEHMLGQTVDTELKSRIGHVVGTTPLQLLVEQMDHDAVWGRVCEFIPKLSLCTSPSTEPRC